MKQVLALLAAILVVASAPGCSEICSNTPVAVVPSPSGKDKAVVFQRKCGTTTEPNTQVAVIPSYSSLSNIPGNALILGGELPLTVRWASDTSLVISGLGTARASRQEASVVGVSIAYEK